MMKTVKKLVLFTIIIAVLAGLLFMPVPASAQDRSLDWKRWDSDIRINADGTFSVKETFEIQFIGGPFSFGFRNIPKKQYESIEGFTVAEADVTYANDYSEAANTFYVSNNGDEYVINWFFPPTTDQTRTFVVEYQVIGGILIDDPGDLLIWGVVGDEHAWDIGSSTVTVYMPPGAIIDTTDGPVSRGTDATTTVSPDKTSVTFNATNIRTNAPLEVYIRFTHGIVPANPPNWQQDYIFQETTGKTLEVVFVVLGLLILIGGFGGIYLLWLFKGRDPKGIEVPEYISEPPSDLPPGIVGTLLDEKADLQDVIATVVDLSRRGFMEIEEEEKSLFGIKSSEFTYRLKPEAGMPEREYEKKLVKGIFGSRTFANLLSGDSDDSALKTEVALDELQDKFYSSLPDIQKSMYREAVDKGLFPVNPKAVRGRYIGIGIAGVFLSLGAMFCVLPMLNLPVTTLWCPAIALVVASIALAIAGSFMPKKTRLGAEEAAKWKAFKAYMKNIEHYADLEAATERFDQFLPYAVAFGLERHWINTFARVPSTPQPRWYIPYGAYPMTRTGSTTGGFDGKLAGGKIPSGRDLRGDQALPGTGLDRMSSGAFSGLSAMSAGLFSALNTTSSVFKSTPSSSGSSGSGGGFSSGGFSGGGFSSGGGGGAGFG